MNQTASVLRALWSKVYNPKSGCPDISLGHLHECMLQVLSPFMGREDQLENWVLAYLSIESPKQGYEIESTWSFINSPHDYDDFEHYDRIVEAERKNVRRAIDNLMSAGKLERDDNGLRIVGND